MGQLKNNDGSARQCVPPGKGCVEWLKLWTALEQCMSDSEEEVTP